ncbi:angiogenin-like [Hemicordylus capensis]|uniref:angiogenin-like n=1 Tax=Hemicordylus capensis TaxID=884348 RepID=UPI002302E2A1|nr:angiogenin-like [Hemicordylus capensis]
MRPSEAAFYLLLVLLVVELLPESTYANNPRYEKFLTQHYNNPKSSFSGKYCDAIMSQRGLTRPQCKEVNTFIHDTTNNIKAVCKEGGEPYGQLRRSKEHMKVTTCKLKGSSTHPRPPCDYRENSSPRYIVIGCEDGWPVHYDESQIVTTV